MDNVEGPDVVNRPESAARTVLYFVAYPQRMAGANRSLFELVSNLPPSIRPLVVVTGEGPVADAYRGAGIPCTVMEPGGMLNSFGKRLLTTSPLERLRIALREMVPFALRLRRYIRDNRVDLVHVNDVRAAGLAAPAARAAGCPVVAHLRGELHFGRVGRFLFESSANRIITVSNAARDTLSSYGRRKAVTVYNGIRALSAPTRRIPWLASLREEGGVVVSSFASVIPAKGQHHLVRAAAILNARGWRDRVVYLCVGDLDHSPDYFKSLRELATSLQADNVTFTGWQSDPFSYYAHTDVSVLASDTEGLPRTNLEAMRAGIPIIGTRVGGVPEQIEDGVNGVLIDRGDAAQLASALERLLSSPADRRAMGEAGLERVQLRFSTDAYVQGVVRVYGDLFGRSAVAARGT